MKKLSIIIPFFNEEKTILHVVNDVLAVDLETLGYTKEIILVNDGSTDKSKWVIQWFLGSHHPHVEIQYLENSKRSWKGFSLKRGFAQANWDLMIVQDADREYTPSDYIPLIKELEEKNLDFIYGSRPRKIIRLGSHYSRLSAIISLITGGLRINLLASLLTLRLITDAPTCYKMFKKKLKPDLLVPPENAFDREPAVTMLLLRKWYKYGESPIHYTQRRASEWKKFRRRRDGVIATITLFKWRFKKIQ